LEKSGNRGKELKETLFGDKENPNSYQKTRKKEGGRPFKRRVKKNPNVKWKK